MKKIKNRDNKNMKGLKKKKARKEKWNKGYINKKKYLKTKKEKLEDVFQRQTCARQ